MHPALRFRTTLLFSRLLLILLIVCGSFTLQAKPWAPDWVTSIAAKPASFDYGKADAAILFDEASINVQPDGSRTMRTRWVVRVLNKDGKDNAVALVSYNTSMHRVKLLQAWLIKANGEVLAFGKKETTDRARGNFNTDLYGEGRQMIISAQDEADTGSVFAFESVMDEKCDSAQLIWHFQSKLPVEYSGLVLDLPDKWRAEGRIYNHDAVTPKTFGTTNITWELRQLPAHEDEPLSPPTDATAAWLAVDLNPPKGVNTALRPFPTWAAISTYYTPKHDAAATPDAAIKAKAASLVATATKPWDRIRPLCLQAQQVNYISIVMNSAASGGLIPRDAAKVFRSNYGDCKDKTALLRSLLKTQDIESFPLIVYSGDTRHVRTDWPAPGQFNHCILAIRVDDSVNVPALIVHPKFGRLVIFDPTNTNTPPGWLPEEVHGSYGLILAGSAGELITLPRMTGDNNRTERKVEARLLADGSVEGSLQETSLGIAASAERNLLVDQSATGYRKTIEKWIARGMPTARVDQVEPADQFDQASFTLKTSFTAQAHGKFMRDTLLVFKPILVVRRNSTLLRKEKRTLPVVIAATSFSEHSRIELPEGFRVDELPAAVELKTAFGTYAIRLHLEDQKHLVVDRAMTLTDAVIPAADYETVRTFYEKMIKAEQSPVVLKREQAP